MNSRYSSLIGIFICALLVTAAILIDYGRAYLFNLQSVVMVIAGTLGIALASYSCNALQVSLRVAINSYTSQVPGAKEVVDSLLHLSMKSKMDGLLALEDGGDRASVLFLKRALSMLVDGFSADELREAFHTEISFFEQRRALQEKVFRHIATLAPAVGVASGIIGLVKMRIATGAPTELVQAIPVCLIPILYGIILAYFICAPIAENIRARTREELLIHTLIAEGVTLIGQEYNTMRLQTRLQSFITPYERDIQNMSIKEIRDKYEELKNSRLDR